MGFRDLGAISDNVRSLARRVAAVPDVQLRIAYVRDLLRRTDPSTCADLFTVIVAQVEMRDHDHEELLLAASVALAERDMEETRRAIATMASAHGQLDVVRMLAFDPPERVAATGATCEVQIEDEEPNDPRVPDYGKGRPLSVGERKSLARRTDRNTLARLLRDPHPQVIRILLSNPKLTEEDIVRLCAKRPNSADVLREVVSCARWIVRYRIRNVLVRNPHTPVEIAVLLALQLNDEDAREVAMSTDLSSRVREVCMRNAVPTTLH